MSERALVALFDVDGTLLDTGGAGGRSWAHAFRSLYDVEVDVAAWTERGQTDPVVAREIFARAIGRAPEPRELGALFARYVRRLRDEIVASEGYRVFDGVVDTLEALLEAGLMLGLVSGNLEGAARIKLERGALNRYFVFGGYGSDAEDRAAVTQTAIRKAAHLHGGSIPHRQILVVGDTPLDVAAAKAVGAVSVTVATGVYDLDQLRSAGADIALPGLDAGFPGL
jgi:phosphoglycolate phosphatase